MTFQLKYTNSEGDEQIELLTTPGNEPPDRAYAAIGMGDVKPGSLYMRRLAQGGTCLIPLSNPDGSWAMTDPKHAGKNFIDGVWQNE